jgi:transposase
MTEAEDGLIVGIDVAKGWLDAAVLQSSESFHIDNDAKGWAKPDRQAQGQAGAGHRYRTERRL